MREIKSKICSRGLTLVELMIGLVLSLLILGAAVSVFMGSKETFRLEEDVAMLQENLRYIADRFKKDFSGVGFSGCAAPFENDTSNVHAFMVGVGNLEVINGTEGGGAPDSINVSYADLESGIPILPGMALPTSPLPVSKNLPLYDALVDNFASSNPVPVILQVSNCRSSDLFLVTGVGDDTLDGRTIGNIKHDATTVIGGVRNTSEKLSGKYGGQGKQTATVYQRSNVRYEIDTVNGETGLYETRTGGQKQLVLDNVTDMQILYGLDSLNDDGNADLYKEWSESLNVADITSLKITLTLIVAEQNGAPVTRDYSFTFKLRDMGLKT